MNTTEKKVFETPVAELVVFEAKDVITTSGDSELTQDPNQGSWA